MTVSSPHLLSLREMRERLKTHWLRQAEIPVEHAVSFPLPSLRWGRPAYAIFASPAIRLPSRPMEQGAPDRWAVLDAQVGRVLLYAHWSVLAFADGVAWETSTVLPSAGSLSALKEAIASIEFLADGVIPAFFSGQSGPTPSRQALADHLTTFLPEPLHDQYRALVPDFFAWLIG